MTRRSPAIGSTWVLPKSEATLFDHNLVTGEGDPNNYCILSQGAIVTILSHVDSSGRVRVFTSGKVGWMNSGWFVNYSKEITKL